MPLKIAIPAAILFVLVVLIYLVVVVMAPAITPPAPVHLIPTITPCPAYQLTVDAAWNGARMPVCR